MTTLQFNEEEARKLTVIYSTPDVCAQREETLRHLALSPGEAVIDVGCGPGFLCESMAEAVGVTGRVLGIDVSEDVLEFARRRNKRNWLTYRQGDAAALEVPDSSFDVAVSTQVLEYIPDVNRAIMEMYRILKPDGRALIVDTDCDSLVWHSAEPKRMAKILRAWESHCIDPRLPRTLVRRLCAAGFVVEGESTYPIVNTRLHEDTYSNGIMGLIANFVSQQETVSRQELDNWSAELRARSDEGQYYFRIMRSFFKVTKDMAHNKS